jgi:hypothetical protein
MDEEDVDILGWALGTLSVPPEYQGLWMERMRKLDYVVPADPPPSFPPGGKPAKVKQATPANREDWPARDDECTLPPEEPHARSARILSARTPLTLSSVARARSRWFWPIWRGRQRRQGQGRAVFIAPTTPPCAPSWTAPRSSRPNST